MGDTVGVGIKPGRGGLYQNLSSEGRGACSEKKGARAASDLHTFFLFLSSFLLSSLRRTR